MNTFPHSYTWSAHQPTIKKGVFGITHSLSNSLHIWYTYTGLVILNMKMGQGEGYLLDKDKLPSGCVASNIYGSLDDLMSGMM